VQTPSDIVVYQAVRHRRKETRARSRPRSISPVLRPRRGAALSGAHHRTPPAAATGTDAEAATVDDTLSSDHVDRPLPEAAPQPLTVYCSIVFRARETHHVQQPITPADKRIAPQRSTVAHSA